MNNERIEKRARMLEKVRKLLSMARDGRGNAHEEAAAFRQANKLMAEFGIAEAECDMSAIEADEMEFGEVDFGADGKPTQAGKVYRSAPTWAGVLGVGVARFTDTIIKRKTTANGKILSFMGEKEDAQLARWLFSVLAASIQDEQRKSGWSSIGEANSFRVAAASSLQKRLQALAIERRAIYEKARAESGSRAIVVVDRKNLEIAQRFGQQKTKSTRVGSSSSGAAVAGSEAGKRINIPAGRPLGGAGQARLTNS